jgi:hypothetical protein
VEFGKETFILRAEIFCHLLLWNNPLRGLFGVSPPRSEAIRVAPQPTEPTVNIYYEILSGLLEKLLANPYVGDGMVHPDMHLIYVEEICGLFKLAGLSEDGFKKNVFLYLWRERH